MNYLLDNDLEWIVTAVVIKGRVIFEKEKPALLDAGYLDFEQIVGQNTRDM